MTKEEVLRKHIPNYNPKIKTWRVLLWGDMGDIFTEKVLEAMDEYAQQCCQEKDREIRELKQSVLTGLKNEGEKDREIAELKAWKESAISVTPPMQEIAKVIGVKLGHSIHDKILPAIQDRDRTIAELREGLERANEKNSFNDQFIRNEIEEHISETDRLIKLIELAHDYAFNNGNGQGLTKSWLAFKEKHKL